MTQLDLRLMKWLMTKLIAHENKEWVMGRPDPIISRKEALEFRSKMYGNTELHKAIQRGQNALAIAYIEQDIEAKDGCDLVNISSGAPDIKEYQAVKKGDSTNTSLLLALKKGNVAVAKKLLQHPRINVNAKDARGLSILHWACMLRQDDIIQLLLDKGADPNYFVKSWDSYEEKHVGSPITPLDQYQQQMPKQIMIDYGQAVQTYNEMIKSSFQWGGLTYNDRADFARTPKWKPFANAILDKDNGYAYRSPFTDKTDLYIPGAVAYTDICFHMRDLCLNFGLKMHKDFIHAPPETFKSPTGELLYRATDSRARFLENYNRGIEAFCDFRNAIPVNLQVLKRLNCKNVEDKKLGQAKVKTEKNSSPIQIELKVPHSEVKEDATIINHDKKLFDSVYQKLRIELTIYNNKVNARWGKRACKSFCVTAPF